MNKSARVIGLALLLAAAAAATDFQQYEIYLGYDFARLNPDTSYVPSFNANGGSAQFVYNFNSLLGVAFDGGAVTKGVLGGYSVDTTLVNFVAGPRVSWNRHSRFRPFAEALFGGAYGTSSAQFSLLPVVTPPILPPGLAVPPNAPVSARLVSSRTGFAMLIGGGLDVKVSKHVFVRPFEVDYYLTRLPDFGLPNDNVNSNNFRYSGGVNFMFGTPR